MTSTKLCKEGMCRTNFELDKHRKHHIPQGMCFGQSIKLNSNICQYTCNMETVGTRERHNRNQRRCILLISIVWIMYIKMDAKRNNNKNIENIQRRENIIYGNQILCRAYDQLQKPQIHLHGRKQMYALDMELKDMEVA